MNKEIRSLYLSLKIRDNIIIVPASELGIKTKCYFLKRNIDINGKGISIIGVVEHPDSIKIIDKYLTKTVKRL